MYLKAPSISRLCSSRSYCTPGPRIMRFLGLRKSRINRILHNIHLVLIHSTSAYFYQVQIVLHSNLWNKVALGENSRTFSKPCTRGIHTTGIRIKWGLDVNIFFTYRDIWQAWLDRQDWLHLNNCHLTLLVVFLCRQKPVKIKTKLVNNIRPR